MAPSWPKFAALPYRGACDCHFFSSRWPPWPLPLPLRAAFRGLDICAAAWRRRRRRWRRPGRRVRPRAVRQRWSALSRCVQCVGRDSAPSPWQLCLPVRGCAHTTAKCSPSGASQSGTELGPPRRRITSSSFDHLPRRQKGCTSTQRAVNTPLASSITLRTATSFRRPWAGRPSASTSMRPARYSRARSSASTVRAACSPTDPLSPQMRTPRAARPRPAHSVTSFGARADGMRYWTARSAGPVPESDTRWVEIRLRRLLGPICPLLVGVVRSVPL